jgi:hypothetical protein
MKEVDRISTWRSSFVRAWIEHDVVSASGMYLRNRLLELSQRCHSRGHCHLSGSSEPGRCNVSYNRFKAVVAVLSDCHSS